MQNLLPLLALKPKTVVQIRSRDERFHHGNRRRIISDACLVVRARLIEGEPDFTRPTA